MSVTISVRESTITGYSNYAGHELIPKQIKNAVLVTITYYRTRKNEAYQYTELWIVPSATLDDYLDKPAYLLRLFTNETKFVKVFNIVRKRFRR